MNHPTDTEGLLDAVLAEGTPAEFREALLSDTLRLARRRRWVRQTRRAATTLAVLAGLAALVWKNLPLRPATPAVTRRSAAVVQTQPLPATALVLTRPLAPECVVSSALSAPVVQTTPDGQFRIIDDSELLTLVAPKPVALVRRAPNLAELVFVNAADREAFLGN